MSAWTANAAFGAALLQAGIALAMGVVGTLAYLRLRHGRLLGVALGMFGLAGEGAYLSWLAYAARTDLAAGASSELLVLPLVNLGIVLALYFAVMKR